MLGRLTWPIVVGIGCLFGSCPANSAQVTFPASGCLVSSSSERKTPLPAVTVSELTFDGDLQMPAAEQAKIASFIKQRTYAGSTDGVAFAVGEKARQAWRERGYFKAHTSASGMLLTGNPVATRIAVNVHVDEGQQYRLRDISIKNNRVVTDEQSLRDLIPLKDGELFNDTMIRQGLDNLRKAYGELGYLNFSYGIGATLDEQSQTVSLDIDVDEGKPYYITSVDIVGVNDSDLKNAQRNGRLEAGRVYNQRLAELFVRKYGPRSSSDAELSSRIHLALDERDGQSPGTVAVTFDFRQCPE